MGLWRRTFRTRSTDISAQYFPETENTPFPLAFGEVSDPQIFKVSVKTDVRTLEKEVRIVQNGTTRIWFVFLNSSDGTVFQVDGLSQSGESLVSKEFSL